MPGDLHTHSSCSDGSTPIEKLPWLAARRVAYSAASGSSRCMAETS